MELARWIGKWYLNGGFSFTGKETARRKEFCKDWTRREGEKQK